MDHAVGRRPRDVRQFAVRRRERAADRARTPSQRPLATGEHGREHGGLIVDILYLLIPLSLVLVVVVGVVFWWSVRNGQFDDLEGPAHRLLQDDDTPAKK